MTTNSGTPALPGYGWKPMKTKGAGFTLIEMSIIIVIIGIILGAGTLGWNAVIEGRKLAKARSTLYEVRDCLVRRMFYNNTYPSYTGDGTPAAVGDNLDCDTRIDSPALDVDACLCGKLDPWGHNIFYVEGVVSDPAGEPLSFGTKYTSSIEPQDIEATSPDRTGSTMTDLNGEPVNYLVFVLISPGKDGLLDDSSYRDLFDGGTSPTSAANIQALASPMNTSAPPNFDRDTPPDYNVSWTTQGDDDIYMYLTAPELRTLLAN